jgi:hypothetical protein
MINAVLWQNVSSVARVLCSVHCETHTARPTERTLQNDTRCHNTALIMTM